MFREPIRFPETSVPNYERPLRNILEVRRPLLHRDGNQKLRKVGRRLEMSYRQKTFTTPHPRT